MKKIIFVVLLISSCTRQKDSVNTNEIVYFKDYKSGLCFAKIEFGLPNYNSNGISISCVPCKNVEHLIEE